ncbi:hypothetical protein, partial [Bosea massiliensis]
IGDLSVQGWRSQPKPNRQSPMTTLSYTTLWDTTAVRLIKRLLDLSSATRQHNRWARRTVTQMLGRMMGWLAAYRDLQRRQRELVEHDAHTLMGRHGASAYYSARKLADDERNGRLVEINRPLGHWSRVRRRIGTLTGLSGRTDSATRRLDE